MSASVAQSGGPGTLHHQHQQQHQQRQVFNWLDDLNLAHLFDKFIENGYEDLELCMKIGETDLNGIGIHDLRERIALLQAVRQLQYHQQQQQLQSVSSSFSSKSSASSFLKALSPTRRKIPEQGLSSANGGGGVDGASSRPPSRLGGGGGGTWGHHEEMELQEIRRYHHFSPSTAHAPASPQSASSSAQLSSFFHQHQPLSHQNTFNELIQRRHNSGGGGRNGFEHQSQFPPQQSMLLLGRRTASHPLHHGGRDFPSADDIHDGAHEVIMGDGDDDNGDYSECTDFDLILSAQRACSSSINHNNNIHQHHLLPPHLSSRLVPGEPAGGIFLEQCTCDCGGGSYCRLHSGELLVDEEPFYESVSPQPPTTNGGNSQQQTPHHQRHRHPSSSSSGNNRKTNHVNYPVPPIPLNYGGGGSVAPNKLVESNTSGGCVLIGDDNSTLSSSSGCGASISGGGSASGGSGNPNFLILRTQLRDQIIQDGINFSRIPDEMTLRAMAGKYASELSSGPNSCLVPPGSGGGTASSSRSTNAPAGSWATQGLPLLEFQQQVLHQLREIWLEERRKLQSSSSPPNSSSSVNPSDSIILGAPSHLDFLHNQYSTGNGSSGGGGGTDHANLVTGYFHSNSPPSSNNTVVSSSTGLFSPSQFNSNGMLESPQTELHQLSKSQRGTPSKHAAAGENQQQRHQYLEPVIITNSPSTSKHQIHKYQPPPPPMFPNSSGFGGGEGRLAYTPGIYQPSSCLRDKDEIYDYIPPRQTLSSKQLRQISPLSKRSGGGSRLQSTMSLGTMRHHNHHSKSFFGGGGEMSKTLLHHQNGKDKTYGFFREVSQTSPRRNNHNLSTLRLLRGNGRGGGGGGALSSAGNPPASSTAPAIRPTNSSMSSYTISGSCSSSNSNNSNGTSSSKSNTNTYGFPNNFNHIGTLTSEIEDYSQSPGANSGCRTLANLSKLSRRLGLSRLFRPSRQQSHHHRQYHHQNSMGGVGITSGVGGNVERNNYFSSVEASSYWIDSGGGGEATGEGSGGTLIRSRRLLQSQPLLLTSPDSSAATSSTAELSSPNGSGSQQKVPNCNGNDGPTSSKASSYQGLASLPSNERIIETINRLKYEELQRRKERIAQEHRMIIREIQRSVHRGEGEGGRQSSSVFYVSNDDDDEDDEGDEDITAIVSGGDPILRLDSPSSSRANNHHAYENIGTSSGSEFGGTKGDGTLEKRRQKTKASNNKSGSGRNKLGFGSVGNLGESCGGDREQDVDDGDHHHHQDENSHACSSGKSVRGGKRCTSSEQNLNDGFTLDEGERRNESENENEFGGPQSLFITERGAGHNFKEPQQPPPTQSRRKSSKDCGGGGPSHLDRKFIGGASAITAFSKKGKQTQSGITLVGGQQPEINGWQVDGNTPDNNVPDNRASYGSSTSRTSTTSSESFSEIFARNLKRTFKSSQANTMKQPEDGARRKPQLTQAFPASYEETDAESLSVRDHLSNGSPQSRNVMQLSPSSATLQQLHFFSKKNKGPTPPPKPKQVLSLAQPPPPPAAPLCVTKSSPELFHHQPHPSEMDPSNFILNPNMEHYSNSHELHQHQLQADQRYLHQSFESVASCPIPPPPKYLRAPNASKSNYRHMSVEMLPSYSYDDHPPDHSPQQYRKLSDQTRPRKPPPPPPPQHYKRREPMSLSDFLKLSSATVFKKSPFSTKKPNSSPLLCGHVPPNNEGALSSSPTPSTLSSSEASGGGCNGTGSPSRSSVVLTFRKKCGVTKRRKKIDESLFTPHTTSSSSCELLHGAVNTLRKSGQNPFFPHGDDTATTGPHAPQHIADADSTRYSITTFGGNQATVADGIDHDKDDDDDDHEGITFVAETNHDTEFELDPLPEKDSDDVMDFSWAPPISQPQAPVSIPSSFNNKKENFPVFHPPPPSSLPFMADKGSCNNNVASNRKQSDSKLQPRSGSSSGGKTSKSNSTRGNGRPSSRCSLIINSLMGHLSGRTKGGGAHHQYSHHNNNNLAHQPHDDHHPDDVTHHSHSSQTLEDDTKPKSLVKKSFQSKLKKSSNKNNLINGPNASSHHYLRMESPRPPPPLPENDCRSGAHLTLDRGRSRNKGISSSSEMLHKNGSATGLPLNGMMTTTSVWARPRSIAAFNLDTDGIADEDSLSYDRLSYRHSFHPPSGSRSLGNISFGGHYHNDNCDNGSFPSLANVIGCIPRASLSNMKKCGGGRTYESGVQDGNQVFQHHPRFGLGDDGAFANNSKVFQESSADAVMTVADYQRRRTCCGGGGRGGLFGGDPQTYDDEKYDKYYGDYSLTGLNIPMINSDTNLTAPYTNSSNNGKSTEEIVLDRYYAHCNKVVRRKEQKPKKKGHSLSEKIWRNVSLPIINSSCANNRNAKGRDGGTHLCDHQRAKQIEECFHCMNEREQGEREKSRESHNQHHHHHHHPSNHNRKQGKKENQNKKRKTKSQSADHLDLLRDSGRDNKDEGHRQRRRSGRDLDDNRGDVGGGGHQLHRGDCDHHGRTKLKKVSSSNSTSSGCSSSEAGHCINPGLVGQHKQSKNVQRFHHHHHQANGKSGRGVDDDVIEDYSSSSSFSYSLEEGCTEQIKGQESKPKFQLKGTSLISSNGDGRCLNSSGRSTSSTSDQDDDNDDYLDGGNDSELDNIALVSANKIGASENEDDYDYEDERKDKTVIVKKGADGGGVIPPNKNKLKRVPTNIVEVASVEHHDDGGESSKQSGKLKGRKGAMNPIRSSVPATSSSQEEDDGIIEDCNSTTSSLTTSPTFSQAPEDIVVIEEDTDKDKTSKDKKNRVKWTFLTSGLAKATRKLSTGSRSSLGSSTVVGSDSSIKKEQSGSSSRSSLIDMVGIGRRRRKTEDVAKEVTLAHHPEFPSQAKVDEIRKKSERSKKVGKPSKLPVATSSENINKRTTKSTEKLNKCKDVVTGGTRRRHTTDVFFRAGRNSGPFFPIAKTATLKRKPSRKERAATVQVILPPSALASGASSSAKRKSVESHQPIHNPGVFLRRRASRPFPPPPPPPKVVKAVSAPVASSSGVVMRGVMRRGDRSTMCTSNNSSVFSAFSTSSCNSSTSGSNRSSTSGYTSNVSRRTSAFLKSFRKRWAKKNNKVANGNEEDAFRSQHDKKDDDDEDDDNDKDDDKKEDDNDNEGDNNNAPPTNGDKHPSRNHHTKVDTALGPVSKLNTIRRKKRTTSRASKHAIFSTFYIGPVIKDPMEEEVIYVTKDFADVTLDLTSGEVKKTSDGTLLFTADPLCFASRRTLKKKREKLVKLNRKLMMKDKQTKAEEEKRMKNERKEEDKGKGLRHVSGSGIDVKGKTGNKVISPPPHNHHPHKNPNQGEIEEEGDYLSMEDASDGTAKPREVISAPRSNSKRDNCNGPIIGGAVKAGKSHKDPKVSLKNKKKSAQELILVEEPGTSKGKSSRRGISGRSIISPRLIKSYLGISKDLLVGANGKNQSADDISGNDRAEEPDTPTRSLLSRLRDSSRSGFGFSSNASSSGGGAASRSSSKKRSSSKQHDNGFQVSQAGSPKNHSSLSDSSGARGCADDGNDQEGVPGKSSTGHHQHQPSCSSEEELASINSCEKRLSSITLGSNGAGGRDDDGEYNGPFQGRAVAIVDCMPSPYDRNALRYKKGDIIDIIAKKPTGLWTGKVNNQIGTFKFINVEIVDMVPIPPPTSSTKEKERREGDDVEEDDVIDDGDEDDSAGDYADTSNYNECSLHYSGGGGGESTRVGEGEEQCSCPSSSRRVNDHRQPRSHLQSNNGGEYRGNSQRLAGALNPWEVEQRQSVANVINGYGPSTGDKRSKERGNYHGRGDPLGILNGEEELGDDDVENEQDEDEEVDEDSQSGDEVDEDEEEEENDDEIIENELLDGETLNQTQMDGKCQVTQKKRNSAKHQDGPGLLSNKKGKKLGVTQRKGRPTSVGDLLQRINLEHYTQQLVQQGFETLDILKDLEEEDLDTIGILHETDRSKILRAVEFLRTELDEEPDHHIPGQSLYQYKYYQATLQKPSKNSGGGVNARVVGGNVTASGIMQPPNHLAPNGANNMSRLLGKGSSVTLQQTGTALSSPHFYRLHHPRDSGIFVGKGDGEEDGDEAISGADLSCAESHPDAETEEIILSPINLQKTSSSSVTGGTVVVTGRAGTGNPNPAWHPHHHHNNNNKQGSHHHINRFISKGVAAPPGAILSVGGSADSGGIPSNSTGISGPHVQTAQQPTSSASSSGSSSSSSGIATAGDTFWNGVSSSSNTNSNGSSSSGTSGVGCGGGPPTSSVVVDQNHSQWSKQGKARDHHHHRRDPSPAYNNDSVRNRFLQAKSLFEPANNGGGNGAVSGGKSRVSTHVYENGGGGGGGADETVMEASQSTHLHLQRVGSQGKALSQNQQQQQHQNRFLYCEKSSDSGISVCTNSPPPLRNEFRN